VQLETPSSSLTIRLRLATQSTPGSWQPTPLQQSAHDRFGEVSTRRLLLTWRLQAKTASRPPATCADCSRSRPGPSTTRLPFEPQMRRRRWALPSELWQSAPKS
jgi:hypothetical protein